MASTNEPADPDVTLFRAYCPETDAWVTGTLHEWRSDEYRIASEDPDTGAISARPVLYDTLTNWTGRRDRNGTMIFTGDILSIDRIPDRKYIYSADGPVVILAPVGYVAMGMTFAQAEKITLDLSKAGITDHIEVTGNILQNVVPDLLEQWRDRRDSGAADGDDDPDDGYDDADEWDDDDDWADWEPDSTVELQFADMDDSGLSFGKAFSEQTIIPEDGECGFRGMSRDIMTWVTGSPVFGTDPDTGEKTCSMVRTEDGVATVVPVLPETVGKISDITDRTGRPLASGDVIVCGGTAAYVFSFRRIENMFAVCPYNMYTEPPAPSDLVWNYIAHDAWKANPEQIMVTGNIYTGLEDWFLEDIDTHMESISGLRPVEPARSPDAPAVPFDRNLEEKKRSMIFDAAARVDAMVHSVDSSLHGWYTHDMMSDDRECVMYGRWKLPGGYEMRMSLNLATMENSLQFGRYGLGPESWKGHGIISYSNGDYSTMVDSMVNVLVGGTPYGEIAAQAVTSDQNADCGRFPMKGGLTYGNVIDRKFGGRDTVSQKEWQKVIRRCFRKSTLAGIECRVVDSTGLWISGKPVTANGVPLVRTVYGGSPVRCSGRSDAKYTKASFCVNTFLTDRDGRFIYSSDIVDHEGLGRLVVYVSDETDPNDPGRSEKNADGSEYMYWMPLDDVTDVIRTGDGNLEWRMIDVAAWTRDRDRITVVGNMFDHFIENPDVIINSGDFSHDNDALPFVFDADEITSTSRSDNDAYWKRVYRSEHALEDEIDRFIRTFPCYRDMPPDDAPVIWKGMTLSDGSPVVQMLADMTAAGVFTDMTDVMVYLRPGESCLGVMFNDSDDPDTRYSPDMYEPIELTNGRVSGMLELDDDTAVRGYITETMSDVGSSQGRAVRIGDFIGKLKENPESDILRDRKTYAAAVMRELGEDGVDMVMCRALDVRGHVMYGRPDPDDMTLFRDSISGESRPYITDTLAWNTWIPDNAGRWVFDCDTLLFESPSGNVDFVVQHRKRLTLDDTVSWLNEECPWDEYCRRVSADDRIVRCVTSVLADKRIEENLHEIQWVPFDDMKWIFRNVGRLYIIDNMNDIPE